MYVCLYVCVFACMMYVTLKLIVTDLAKRLDVIAEQLNTTSVILTQSVEQVNTECHDIVDKQNDFVNSKVSKMEIKYFTMYVCVLCVHACVCVCVYMHACVCVCTCTR